MIVVRKEKTGSRVTETHSDVFFAPKTVTSVTPGSTNIDKNFSEDIKFFLYVRFYVTLISQFCSQYELGLSALILILDNCQKFYNQARIRGTQKQWSFRRYRNVASFLPFLKSFCGPLHRFCV